MSMINVGLIGCGSFVRHTHLANILADKRFRLYATADLNLEAAQKIANESGAAYATDDTQRLMDDPNVEMVFICTPHHNHAPSPRPSASTQRSPLRRSRSRKRSSPMRAASTPRSRLSPGPRRHRQ